MSSVRAELVDKYEQEVSDKAVKYAEGTLEQSWTCGVDNAGERNNLKRELRSGDEAVGRELHPERSPLSASVV